MEAACSELARLAYAAGAETETKIANRRFEVSMNDALASDFDSLVTETGASSRSEVFRRAIAAYKALKDAEKRGDSVLLESSEGQVREFVAL